MTGVAIQETNPNFIARVGRHGWSGLGYAGYSTDGGSSYKLWNCPADAAGGRIAVSATSEAMVWATQSGPCYYSNNRGTTWTAISTLPTEVIGGGANVFNCGSSFPIAADKVNGNKFYVYKTGKLYVSTNGGSTFTQSSVNLPNVWYTNPLVVEPTPGKEGDIWISMHDAGLYHSTNSGASFTKLTNVQLADFVSCGKASPSTPTIPALYVYGTVNNIANGLFRSNDNGATWETIGAPVQTGKTPYCMVADRQVYGRVFFGTNGNGLLYTEDSGFSDTQAPSVPTSLLTSDITSSSITISWSASTDNVGVLGYNIYQDGVLRGTTSATSYQLIGLNGGTTYSITVQAKDAAGNVSAQSNALNVTTQVSQVNIALNKISTASSQQTSNTAAMGNDGSLTSRWAANSGNANEWYKVDLGANYNINGAEITWEHSDWIYYYKIEVSVDDSIWVMAMDKTANTFSGQVEDVQLASNGFRYIRLTNTGWANYGNVLPLLSFYEFKVYGSNGGDTQAPTAPTSLVSSNVSQSGFTLTWVASTDNVGVTGYEVFKDGVSVGTATTTSMNLSGLTAGTTYSMIVRAKDAAGNVSAASNALSVTTLIAAVIDGKVIREVWNGISGGLVTDIPLSTAPSTTNELASIEGPTNVADNYGTRIRGYIVPSSSGNYTFYVAGDDNCQLFLSTNDDPANKSKIAEVITWTNSREWTKELNQKSGVISLTANAKYYFEVLQKEAGGGDNIAVGWIGPGITSITVVGSANISSYNSDTQAPTAPTSLVSSDVSQTGFTLTWVASTDNVGVTGYEVFKDGVSVGTATTTLLSITGLACGTSYDMTVRARDVAGNWSAQSALLKVVTASCPDTQAPSVPSGLISSLITQTSFTLNWTASTDNIGVTGYEVFRDGVFIGTSTSTTYSITGLTASTTYSMTVRARDAAGNWSTQSSAISVTTNAASNAFPIPGTIQAEDYTNMYGLTITDHVGYVDPGDWIEYNVNIATAGNYAMTFHASSSWAGGACYITVDGGASLGTFTCPNTGGWTVYNDYTINVILPAGLHTLRVNYTNAAFNTDYMVFTKASPIPGTIQAEDYTAMYGLTITDHIGYVDPGDWVEYEVNIATAGTYTMTFHVASAYNNCTCYVNLDGGASLGTFTCPNTGGWAIYADYSIDVAFPVGIHTLRVNYTNGAFNTDYMVFTETLKSANIGVTTIENPKGQQQITIYPMPVTDYLNISGIKDYSKIDLFNSLSQLINTYNLNMAESFTIEMSSYKKGIYYIRLSNGKSKEIRKIIKY
jgi:chitodextrinase